MPKIVWMIQQTQRAGGTEIVSLNLAKALKKYYNYELMIIVVSEKGETSFLELDGLDVQYLNMPKEVVCFDEFFYRYLNEHHYLKTLKLFKDELEHFFFKRNDYRKKILEFTSSEDIIIASSADSYLLAPNGRKTIFHFHFDAQDYLNPFLQSLLSFSRKPDYTVFLSNSTRDNILIKKPELKNNSCVIYNPSRLNRRFIPKHDNLNLVFIGRLENQKNPELLIETCRELSANGFRYHLDILGDGSKRDKIANMIKEYELENVSLRGLVKNVEDYLSISDGLLVTSRTEGFALSIIEANSLSLYCVSTHCGDAIYEVIKEGQNGTVVDSENPKVLANKIIESFSGDYSNYKQSAYDYSINFDIKNIIQKWDDLFKRI